MDRIRTLLLARTHTVVLDADRVASAATRPTRDSDADKLEAELAELGFVMSIDLAMTVRRLPYHALHELRRWIVDTLATRIGTNRPHVPLFRNVPAGSGIDATQSLYLRRILSWLLTVPEQPCPWCGQIKIVGALDPCGHLVCRSCWSGGNYAGCPICHRRVAINDAFYWLMPTSSSNEHVLRCSGTLTLLHLGFDVVGTARLRFERLLARTTPLSPEDRVELEAIIDALGPTIALPERIPVRETMAIVIARLWLVAPDRAAMVAATMKYVRTATDVLRIAAVLMGGNPELVEPMKLVSIARNLRRAILGALERLPIDQLVEDLHRHKQLWKRIGERLHPFELADAYPNATLAFAIVRRTRLTTWPALRAHAVNVACVRVEDERAHAIAWAGPIEDALRLRNPRSALGRLTHRPAELLRRADHLVRIAQDHQVDALETIVKGIRIAVTRGAPSTLFVLASHMARRGRAWPRRVFFPKGEVLRAWTSPDRRPLVRADAIGAIVGGIRHELLARAELRRHFARAVIDRALVDLLLPIGERTSAPTKLTWPRGSELALPTGNTMRLFLHWEEPPTMRVDLDLTVVLFDHQWRHCGTSEVHSGAAEFVDLDLEALRMMNVRHAVMVVVSSTAVSFDRLTHAFAGVMMAPVEAAPFDPLAVHQRFDLRGRSLITVPLTIDIAERRLRWLDVHIKASGNMHQVGGYRAALAHIGRDFADLLATQARPTMWDLAAIHAAARANLVYVRERDGAFRTYRRRDNESIGARLARVLSGGNDEGKVSAIPATDAPTWFALVAGDLALPAGSTGYMLDGRNAPANITRLRAADLVAELSR